jgi:methionyl-tRNA synthetase
MIIKTENKEVKEMPIEIEIYCQKCAGKKKKSKLEATDQFSNSLVCESCGAKYGPADLFDVKLSTRTPVSVKERKTMSVVVRAHRVK